MGTPAKPNSSYAANRLTRKNGPNRSLLSNFNKQPDVKPEAVDVATKARREDSNATPAAIAVPSSPLSSAADSELSDVPSEVLEVLDTEDVLPSTELGTRLEPGTDDEPLSSEEESSDIEASPPRKVVNYVTLEQKLAESKASEGSLRKTKLIRTMSDMTGDSDEDEILSSWSSSQSKRPKFNTYQTKGSYFNRPAFARPAQSPEAKAKETPRSQETPKAKEISKSKQTPKAKATSESKETPLVEKEAVEELDEPEVTFIVPKDIMSPTFTPQEKENNPPGASQTGDYAVYNSGADSPLSTTSSSFFKGMEVDKEPSPPPKSLCPMCKVEVDPEILAEFKSQPNQRIREQQQFCESHKLRSALQQWEQRKYPTIAWDQFETRVQSLFPAIEKLLVPDAPSYYRNTLDGILASGKAKNFRLTIDGKALEVITCGYYGTKGASLMLDAVVARFSRSLRRLAATDRIVKTAGVAGYAQCVLVPELAMRLVKQDMGVDDEEARQIMRESMDIGQKLNPEANDVVPVPAGLDGLGLVAQSDDEEEDEEEEEEEEELEEEEEEDKENEGNREEDDKQAGDLEDKKPAMQAMQSIQAVQARQARQARKNQSKDTEIR